MPDQRNSIPRWVSLLYRYGQMYMGDRLKHLDIGRGQYIFLNVLYREDGLSQEALSDYLKIDKGTTAKALKKLEAEGYVVRKVRTDDRRTNRVFLTEKALSIKTEVRQAFLGWREVLTQGFDEADKEAALQLLERMGTNAARSGDRDFDLD